MYYVNLLSNLFCAFIFRRIFEMLVLKSQIIASKLLQIIRGLMQKSENEEKTVMDGITGLRKNFVAATF